MSKLYSIERAKIPSPLFHVWETELESRDECKIQRIVATVYREDEAVLFVKALELRADSEHSSN